MLDKHERTGWTWIETITGGFWLKNTGSKHKYKLPFFCPYEECRKPTGTVDDEYLLKFGVCRTCHTLYVADRKTPLIDVDIYRKRLEDRGF